MQVEPCVYLLLINRVKKNHALGSRGKWRFIGQYFACVCSCRRRKDKPPLVFGTLRNHRAVDLLRSMHLSRCKHALGGTYKSAFFRYCCSPGLFLIVQDNKKYAVVGNKKVLSLPSPCLEEQNGKGRKREKEKCFYWPSSVAALIFCVAEQDGAACSKGLNSCWKGWARDKDEMGKRKPIRYLLPPGFWGRHVTPSEIDVWHLLQCFFFLKLSCMRELLFHVPETRQLNQLLTWLFLAHCLVLVKDQSNQYVEYAYYTNVHKEKLLRSLNSNVDRYRSGPQRSWQCVKGLKRMQIFFPKLTLPSHTTLLKKWNLKSLIHRQAQGKD